ncbi:unnamed protein product [Rotaria socialis]|uniref:SWIM-type domain-containing protein n=1 Tax=Rotaria socialis TaxID=392032 RepID=A0A820HLY0_9BILA|nr:unnamed protein product [Rotaria socialis]CAF3343945.1 unnamed protein product [Rotaria socialis]CAF3623081.1 unnamed protein product [Rotaria socialis]CAF4295409.1 unnamed protein product [Rotaria socialis]CAF4519542.1 unnamed protein product [Rotaria socialis]
MIICATDGYIISAIGPYLSDWYSNDAAIIKHILLNNKEEVQDWLVEKDIIIVDRGFRDCLDLVNSFGYTTFLPLFLPKSKKQFSTSEANNNRFVTALRWVVESVNGRIKTFKFFEHVVQNSSLLYVHDFPKLTEADLKYFTLGVFQLKQARSYNLEHISEDGQYEIHVCKQQQNLLRANLQSKHSNRKDYNVLIQYNDQTVIAACCACRNENRNIGCCSHIASIIWYLGIARHTKHKYLNHRSSSYMKLFEEAAEVSDLSSDEEDDDAILYSLA